ncbi:hypothetical protein ACHHYP_08761 [Achlya hypogyna]|uniref:DNA helicase n=1 Tax=Achlya hypogyna TaxID=1202772 RepID=A0A1V9ZJZ9_ACHHY|nr:hypothetical protein ACHHYP_08761 [Achlya hypogyna]
MRALSSVQTLSEDQRRLVAHAAPGRVTIVRGFPGTGKTTCAAAVLTTATSPTLGLTPQAFETSLRRYVDDSSPIGFLGSRDGAEVISMGEWSGRFRDVYAHTSSEKLLTSAEARVFILDHLEQIPRRSFRSHKSAPMLRNAVADTFRCFEALERHGVSPETYAEHLRTATAPSKRSLAAVADYEAAQIDLCNAYAAYRDVLHAAHTNTRDGVVLDALQLADAHPFLLHASLDHIQRFVVDDLDQMTPAALQLLAHMMHATNDKPWLVFTAEPADDLLRLLAGTDLETVCEDWTAHFHPRPALRALAEQLFAGAPVTTVDAVQLRVFATPQDEVKHAVAQAAADVAAHKRMLLVAGEAAAVPEMLARLAAAGVPATSLERTDLFAHKAVRACYALLQALAAPTDSKHLFALLQASTYLRLAPVALAEVVEQSLARYATNAAFASSRRSHVHLYDALAAYAATEPPLAAFLALFDRLRARAMELPATELLHQAQARIGDLTRLLEPATPADAEASDALAAFLRLVSDAQDAAGSPFVPFVASRVAMLRAVGRTSAPRDFALLDTDADAQVLVASLRTAWRLPAHVKVPRLPVPRATVDSLLLTHVHDKALPGRKPRGIGAGVLPPGLVGATMRDDHVAASRVRLAALLLRATDRVVLSHAAAQPLSRLVAPWPEPVELVPAAQESPPALVAPLSAPPPPPFALEHLSFTQIDEYLRCPHRYELSRVLRLEPKANASMVYGRALHEAIAAWTQRASETEAAEDARAALERAWTPGSCRSAAEETALRAQAQDALASFIEYEAAHGTAADVQSVEEAFELTVPEADVLLRGVWDRVERRANGDVFIVEFKANVANTPRDNQALAEESLQLKLYMLAYHRLTGSAPRGAVLRSLESVHGQCAPGIVEHSAASDAVALEAIVATAAAIRARSFEATPSFLGCSFCAFGEVCSARAAV